MPSSVIGVSGPIGFGRTTEGGLDVVGQHNSLAHGDSARADYEFGRLRVAAAQTPGLGLECHAGHGLDYDSARVIAGLPQIVELNIGHFLIGEAIFVGLAETVRTMRAAMEEGRAPVERRR